jgi:hypothetical protein
VSFRGALRRSPDWMVFTSSPLATAAIHAATKTPLTPLPRSLGAEAIAIDVA